MATLGKLKSSGRHVVVIGTGYGMHSSARPGKILGELFPAENAGEARLIAIATACGEIYWCPSSEVEIVGIDGKSPAELLEGLPSAETGADLDFAASTPDEVRWHPRFTEFIKADPNHKHVYEEDLVEKFAAWQKSSAS